MFVPKAADDAMLQHLHDQMMMKKNGQGPATTPSCDPEYILGPGMGAGYGSSASNYGSNFTGYGTGGYASAAELPEMKHDGRSYSPETALPRMGLNQRASSYNPLPSSLMPPARPPIVGELRQEASVKQESVRHLPPLGQSPSDPHYLRQSHESQEVPTSNSRGFSGPPSRIGTGSSYRKPSNPRPKQRSRSSTHLRNAGAAVMGNRGPSPFSSSTPYGNMSRQRRRIGGQHDRSDMLRMKSDLSKQLQHDRIRTQNQNNGSRVGTSGTYRSSSRNSRMGTANSNYSSTTRPVRQGELVVPFEGAGQRHRNPKPYADLLKDQKDIFEAPRQGYLRSDRSRKPVWRGGGRAPQRKDPLMMGERTDTTTVSGGSRLRPHAYNSVSSVQDESRVGTARSNRSNMSRKSVTISEPPRQSDTPLSFIKPDALDDLMSRQDFVPPRPTPKPKASGRSRPPLYPPQARSVHMSRALNIALNKDSTDNYSERSRSASPPRRNLGTAGSRASSTHTHRSRSSAAPTSRTTGTVATMNSFGTMNTERRRRRPIPKPKEMTQADLQALKYRVVIKMEIRQVYSRCHETLMDLVANQNKRLQKSLSGSRPDLSMTEVSKRMDKFSSYKKKIEGEIDDYGMDELRQVSDTVKEFDRERNQLIADLRSSTESMDNVKRRLYSSHFLA